jgi:2-oxo-4-hydroxy-4-carboxy-5-ureidoimidazoline decarboxylase
MSRYTISEINSLPLGEFVRAIGPAFERSPWIAELAWAKRPFTDREQLLVVLCGTVKESDPEKQLALIRAHPDLVGQLALSGQLTEESSREQASVGLDRLTPEESVLFQSNNAVYRGRFGFPFVICARLNKKEAILAGFAQRLHHSREQEIKAALEEIFKIAELRLRDLIAS